jgi:hypothetical protein
MATILNEFHYQQLMGELATGLKKMVWTDAMGWTPVLTDEGRRIQNDQYTISAGVPPYVDTEIPVILEDTAMVLNCLESSGP